MTLNDVNYVEFNADTWDYGYTLWVDGVQFAPCEPVTGITSNPGIVTAELQIYPDPFVRSTNIVYSISAKEHVLVKIFEAPLVFNEEIAQDLKKRYKNLQSLQYQASMPKNATQFKNTLGSAYGIGLKKGNKWMLALPGVPQEMKEMFIKEVLPFIEKNYVLSERIREKNLYLSFTSGSGFGSSVPS